MQVNHAAIQPEEFCFTFCGVTYRYLVWGEVGSDSPGGGAPCDGERDGAHANGVRGSLMRSGRAPLVLLHGFAQSASSWNEVAACLAVDRPVVALDLVGHGGSDCPQDACFYGLNEVAVAVCAFLEYLADWVGVLAVPVVGYSMGGRVALSAAGRNPRLFAALVLEGAGLGPVDDQERAQAAARDARSAARLRTDGLEAFMHDWERLPLFATQSELPVAVQERIRSGRLSNDAEALARTFEGSGQHVMPSRAETLATLAHASFPVLYLAGGRDQKYRAIAQDAQVRDVCEVRIIGDAGHNVHLEAPGSYCALVGDFLCGALGR